MSKCSAFDSGLLAYILYAHTLPYDAMFVEAAWRLGRPKFFTVPVDMSVILQVYIRFNYMQPLVLITKKSR